jgi:hypothetical protein
MPRFFSVKSFRNAKKKSPAGTAEDRLRLTVAPGTIFRSYWEEPEHQERGECRPLSD